MYKFLILVLVVCLIAGCGGSSGMSVSKPVIINDILINSSCSENQLQKPFYFSQVPQSLPSYIVNKFNLPYIDVRYTKQPSEQTGIGVDRYPYTGIDSNIFTDYTLPLANNSVVSYLTDYAKSNIDGTAAQVACINGNIVFSAVVNGHDSIPIDTYGGPAITFGYSSDKEYYPWQNNNSLHITGDFKQAYQSDPNEVGAQLNIGVFIRNVKTNDKFLYDINIYNSFGKLDKESIQYDPTLKTAYTSTFVSKNSRYVTIGNSSKESTNTTTTLFTPNDWPDHYSFYITQQNLINAFNDTHSKELIDSNLSDWVVYIFVIQSEINISYNQILATSGTNINLSITSKIK